ncbi:MAG: hypothetical protein IJF76_04890 [Clostridia bacterium]|nr:hypothetical protein [Clostridia bacterium]
MDDVAYNNLKAEVSNYDLLEEMEDVIAGIEDEIDDVEAAIANIGTVVFTTDCAEKIDAARDAFEALDADIVAADKAAAAGEPTIVANYATLVEAEAKYAELAEDFAELKASIDAMAAAFDSQTNILAKYIEARTLYLKAEAVAPEMVARLAGEAFDNVDYPTYAEAYDFYAARALAMEGKVNVIIAAINNFVVKWNNTVTLDDADCATELVGIKADYDSLASDMERAAVTNSHIMFEKLAELEDLLAVADVWVDAVNAIVEPITATDASFGQVLAAKAEFEKLSTGAQATMASIAVTADDSVWNKYAEAYDKYADTLADYNYLNNLIKDLADDMGAIVAPTNLTAEATWRAGVEAIADRYEDLEDVDDNAQAYLEAHYLTEYKHFIAMMRHIALVDAYEAIEALPDAADVEITDRAEIAAARALVDAYDGDLADIINLAKLEDVEAARDAIIARLEKWESDVLALVGNYDNIANIIVDANALPIDLAKAYALKATYDAMPVAEQDYTAEDNVDDYAKLVEIITKAEAKATTVAEAMEDVVALGDNVETTDIADIIAVDDAYSDLSESQKAYIDANYPGLAEAFIKQVQKLIIADSFESIVDELYDAVVASGYDITSDTPVILGLVKSMYNSFTKEQRALIGNYNKVGEIEAAYEAALAAGKVVNVTELNGIVANIKAALEVAEGDIDALQAALTAANDQIKLLDEQLELAQSNHAKDLAEANKNVETLQGTVTTIIIIFSILVAGLVAAVVVLFIKRK